MAMAADRAHNPMLWSTIAIAILVACTSAAGIFWPATYARETLFQKAGGIGSDLTNLFLAVPVLLISGINAYRGSVPARLVWLGTLGYLLYNLPLYVFGVHFNGLFPAYCATLSLCFYATVFSVRFVPLEQFAQAYSRRAPRKTAAILFLVLALLFAAFDLSEILPAILSGRVPQSAIQANTPVNFVHALDLTFLLPCLCIAAFLLFRKKESGYALAPAILALLAIMSFELAVLMEAMARMGCFGMSYPMVISFLALGVGSTILLWFYFHSGLTAGTESKSSKTALVHSH
jgi:hypothetical protein